MKKISDVLPENPIVTVDIGQTVCWAAQSLTIRGTQGRVIIGGSYGAMGVGFICGFKGILQCIFSDAFCWRNYIG